MKKATRKRVVWICMVALIGLLSASIARADFYVVAAGKKAKKTILVSPKGTETASGTALLNAINSITDAGVTNPYLVIIEPGIYDVGTNPLQMKEYVDIQGSGEKVTKITRTIDSDAAGVLLGADNAEVRFLTVENTGVGTDTIAIFNYGVSPKITNVTAIASGGEYNTAVHNFSSCSPKMTNVTATGSGGTYNYGVNNSYSSPTMTNVTATGTGSGSGYAYGVRSNHASPTMTNITATASGGTCNYAVHNSDSSPMMTNVVATVSDGAFNIGVNNINSSYPTMTNVTAIVSGGSTDSYGVSIATSSGVTIHNSVLSGDDAALYNDSSGVTTYIGTTRLISGVTGSGPTICSGVYDGDFTFYADTCP